MPIAADTVLLTFLLFCRIGGCLMLMPGFSSPRIPVQVRLFLAIAATLALMPLLLPMLQKDVTDLSLPHLIRFIVSETAVGALIGVMGRFFFLALQFMATAVAQFIGLGTLPGPPVEEAEPSPPIATLITLSATVLLFLTDQHWEVFRALVASYSVLPVNEPFSIDASLRNMSGALGDSFVLALQISGPFVIYGLIVNLLFGLANKMIPQIPIYFISLPFVFAGGIVLLYFTMAEFLTLFTAGFMTWLAKG
ncbi:MAG: flagellar biosynthesis protein FliR [Bacteroidota bacterium]|jgi:flagellar biosynthetic protein FliR